MRRPTVGSVADELRDEFGAGDAGVEGGELGAVTGGEGEEVAVGGVFRAFHVSGHRRCAEVVG